MKKYAILITFLLVICLFVTAFLVRDQILANKMIEKYSDDKNYVTLVGEIVELNGNSVVIKCEEAIRFELCEYCIYSDQLIELQIGEQIEFSTVLFHFYNGHKLPIVEIKKDGSTILSFEEGKGNLIDWVNANFK